MKACAAFDDRLLDYGELSTTERLEVDEHVNRCAACRRYLAVLQEIDEALTAEVSRIHVDPRRYTDVRQKAGVIPIPRASRLPEWLDFVAAGAICAFSYALAWQTGLFMYLADVVGR